jgi:hypothetical protein
MAKGSRQRPTKVPMEQVDNNYESIFGKRVPTYMKKLIEDYVPPDHDAEAEDEAFRMIEKQNNINKG